MTITMSREELTRLRVLIDIADGRLSVADATGLIGIGRRQIYRLNDDRRPDLGSAEGPTETHPSTSRARDCLGELVQIDGSEHWWFEDRGRQCTLLVYVDDATSRLMHLKSSSRRNRPSTTFRRPANISRRRQAGCVLQRQARRLSGQ